MRVVALVADLMDRSRVAAAIPGVRFVTTPAGLAAAAGEADLVIVDLGRPGALDAAVALAQEGANVVGYASHVATDVLDRAGAAGCTALARSVFFRRLPALVAGADGTALP
jgi:hypothetical protein